jgi:hypothetical protein
MDFTQLNNLETNMIFEGKYSSKTKIISTNVFIPENIQNIDIKTYNYFTGFVKNCETFNNRTTEDFALYIYIDEMLIPENSNYNNSVYQILADNEHYNTSVKGGYHKNKDELKRLLELYKKYISVILKSENDKYSRIKLISYTNKNIKNIKKKYLGHTATFGSIVRFLPMLDSKNELVFCINISHAISVLLFSHIKKFEINEDKILITVKSYGGRSDVFDVLEYIDDLEYIGNNDDEYDDKTEKEIQIRKTITANMMPIINNKFITLSNSHVHDRIPAGLFGIKPKKYFSKYGENNILTYNNFIKYIHNVDILFNHYITKESVFKINPYSYGVDEHMISNLLSNVLEDKNKENKENYIYYFDNYNIDYNIISKGLQEHNTKLQEHNKGLPEHKKSTTVITNEKIEKIMTMAKIPINPYDKRAIRNDKFYKTKFEVKQIIEKYDSLFNEYQTKLSKLFNTTNPVHEHFYKTFLGSSRFVTPEFIFNSPESFLKLIDPRDNPFFCLLSSFDETNPLIITNAGFDKSLEVITQSLNDLIQTPLTILKWNNPVDVDEQINILINHYNIRTPQYTVNIYGKDYTFDMSKWSENYMEYFFIEKLPEKKFIANNIEELLNIISNAPDLTEQSGGTKKRKYSKKKHTHKVKTKSIKNQSNINQTSTKHKN